jgi:membrane protein DedA with SNARE-associated domain
MTKWITDLIYSTGYFGIILLMFVENVFPPIPSELIMPLAGFMVTKNQFTLAGIIIAGTFGSVIGALPIYYLGAKLGKDRLVKFADKHGRWFAFSADDIERSQQWFERHGGKAVFLCRLVPGLRSLISFPAGVNKMPLVSFLLYSTIGMGIWTTFLAVTGYILTSNFTQVEKYLDPFTYVVLGILLILYVYRLLNNNRKKADSQDN